MKQAILALCRYKLEMMNKRCSEMPCTRDEMVEIANQRELLEEIMCFVENYDDINE